MVAHIRSVGLTAGLLLSLTAPATAWFAVDAPSLITADSSTQISITADYDAIAGGDTIKNVTHYILWLCFGPGVGAGLPKCILRQDVDIKDLNPTVEIPASVGPSQGEYSIAMDARNATTNEDGLPIFAISSDFFLRGGTGEWSVYEEESWIDYNATIPCSSWDCARQCAQKYYPDDLDHSNTTVMDLTSQCISECPGVPPPTANDSTGGDGSNSTSSSAVSQTSAGTTTSSGGSPTQTATVAGSNTNSSSSGVPTNAAAVGTGSLSMSCLFAALLTVLAAAV